MASLSIDVFRSLDANPGGTLQLFLKYTERIELMFELVFRKSEGTPYTPTDREKKALLLFKGGDDMKNLFQFVGMVEEKDTYAEAIEKIKSGLLERTNKVVQRNLLLADFPQGNKSFEKWSQQISNAAQLIDYKDYDWKQAAVDAILLQTSNAKLRERALQENTTYDALMRLGIAKEQSAKGAALLEQASGGVSYSRVKVEEEVRRLQNENDRLRANKNAQCTRCGYNNCQQGSKCPANGQRCHKCGNENHLSKMCRSKTNSNKGRGSQKKGKKKKNRSFGQLSSAEESESEESSGRIVVGHLGSSSICAKIGVRGFETSSTQKIIDLATDTGISKTLLNRNDWEKVKDNCKFVKTSKRFRPYGTAYHLPIKGKARVLLTAERGAQIETWAYIVDDKKEQSLLGEGDATRLGIVTLDLKGADTEVVKSISYTKKVMTAPGDIVSGGETQEEIDANMEEIVSEFPKLFTNATGKVKGPPIEIQVRENAVPVVQPQRRIPLHYMDRLKTELEKMLSEDIIEGPIQVEEPGTFISNLVITDKKDTGSIRVTLDCQSVNREIYTTHEPIPTSDELRHGLLGSDRFSTLDMTNCYHQFEIAENARKLFAFRSPWGIYRYKRMVMGTSPASSEIQKRIRNIVQDHPNAMHIKDDILVHGVGKEHDEHLKAVLNTLQEKGITCRPSKCHLGQEQAKWFGQIYSKQGVSPDPDKCQVIKDWPPASCSEVKSYLQPVQFNAKFLGGGPSQRSYPELTEPLRALTKKFARFQWGKREETAFAELKERLCSDKVLVPYDLKRQTRLYVDSSPVGTQATVCQLHTIDGNDHWRPVNHTSRSWTGAESRYGQIERESNGILTGMFMNKMYTLGTHVEVVTDHEPLLSAYNSHTNPKQLRVDRHRTKLLPFSYNVIYEAGSKTPCDYGSRHPPKHKFTEEETEDWCIESGSEIYVNRVVEDMLPCAITLEMVQKETKNDDKMKKLMSCITSHDKIQCQKEAKEYSKVFDELTVINGTVLKGRQIVIPESMRADVIGLAHEGHQYAEKTLNLLRQSCWFPGMRKDVLDYVQSCISCLASIPQVTPVPLQPNMLPERAWQNLHADFKGPIADSYYLHVVIDQYSKYPEVDIVSSTSFAKLRPKLDQMFCRHGIPETMTADNGPPYPSEDMKKYAEEHGFKMTLVTPENPQSNGFAEIFVKVLCKLLHTASAEGKDPRKELNKYLLQYRATPHPTTGKSPAEMLFGRRIRTKLPQLFSREDSPETASIREAHDKRKIEQKRQYDRRHRAKNKSVEVGDKILIRQKKTTSKPPFDPAPYTTVKVDGNRVHAKRGDKQRCRDKNDIKVVKERPDHLKPKWEARANNNQVTSYDEFDIEANWKLFNKEAESQSSYSSTSTSSQQEESEEVEHESAASQVQRCETPANSLTSYLPEPYTPSHDGGELGGGAVSLGEVCAICRASIFQEGGLCNNCSAGLSGTRSHGVDNSASNIPISNSQAPKANANTPKLKKGATVMFKGKEPDDEWFTCTLTSRAGTAKGKYSLAWNILRDGLHENIDFERDVSEYKLVAVEPNEPPLEATAVATDLDMDIHLQALLTAAEERAKNC